MAFEPERFGNRLRSEMERRSLDVKSLQEQVQRRAQQQVGKKRGTSYGTIWSYVNGRAPVEPRREVVEALGHVLGVLPEYLTDGGPRTRVEAEAMGTIPPGNPDGDERSQRVALLIRAMRSAEARLQLLAHDAFLGRTQMLEGLTVAFLESGGKGFLDYTPEQVEEAMMTVAWLIYFPAESLGAIDFRHVTGERDAYFYAMASALRIAMSGHDTGFPLNAMDSTRAMREAWEGRLPRKMRPEAIDELTRDRGRSDKKESKNG